jgi:hypothetical protein
MHTKHEAKICGIFMHSPRTAKLSDFLIILSEYLQKIELYYFFIELFPKCSEFQKDSYSYN